MHRWVSDEYNADLVGFNRLNTPVVEVVGQFSITRLEDEVAPDDAVLQNLSHIENIKVGRLGKDERIPNQLLHASSIVALDKVVVRIGGVDLVVVGVIENGRVKSIE